VGLVSVTDQLQSTVDLERHGAERVESTPLKTELISGSHEKSNSSEMKTIILKTLIGHVDSQFREGTSQSES